MSKRKPITVAEICRLLDGPSSSEVLQQLGSAIRAHGSKRLKAYRRHGGPVDLAERLEVCGASIASIAPVLKHAPRPPRGSYGRGR